MQHYKQFQLCSYLLLAYIDIAWFFWDSAFIYYTCIPGLLHPYIKAFLTAYFISITYYKYQKHTRSSKETTLICVFVSQNVLSMSSNACLIVDVFPWSADVTLYPTVMMDLTKWTAVSLHFRFIIIPQSNEFKGEILCLKLLQQFSGHLNETCYTWSLWWIDVHYKGLQSYATFSKLLYIYFV